MAETHTFGKRAFECELYASGDLAVEVCHPDYASPPSVRVEISAVRAADAIIIRYDFERDGWSVRMNRTVEGYGMMEVVEEAVEMAFVPAWNSITDPGERERALVEIFGRDEERDEP